MASNAAPLANALFFLEKGNQKHYFEILYEIQMGRQKAAHLFGAGINIRRRIMGFTLKDILHNKARHLLHIETDPGLGCTEPAAIGLCAAAAAALLENPDIEFIEVTTDPNIYKNAMGVIIPGSGGRSGIPLAAALGAVAGKPKNSLQVFSTVDKQGIEDAESLLKNGKVSAGIKEGHDGLYVKTVVKAGGHTAEAVIAGRHDHIQFLGMDGQPQQDHPLLAGTVSEELSAKDLGPWLTSLSLEELVDLSDGMNRDDATYIQRGIDLNMRLVRYGFSHGPGLGVGKTQQSLLRQGLLKNDMVLAGGMFAAAGIDSRMGGVMLPAMTLAGSGNQGISAGTPIVAASEFATIEDNLLLIKSVTLSYLVTCYIKTLVGRIGPLCGSAVAGGSGVAAGLTYLLGGTAEKIGGAIKNHIENTATLLCDGAKTSCALKVGEAVSSGVKSALMALQGTVVKPVDGIIGESPEESMRNLGKLVQSGLGGMDPAILNIMLTKCA
ncbi:MAG: serine dehydratase subunit alpha family protein [Deltaproteobacteria bacterium]|nr:serine dehydratase subunit alpha family protein [Deltaproteobacteria bacterium]